MLLHSRPGLPCRSSGFLPNVPAPAGAGRRNFGRPPAPGRHRLILRSSGGPRGAEVWEKSGPETLAGKRRLATHDDMLSGPGVIVIRKPLPPGYEAVEVPGGRASGLCSIHFSAGFFPGLVANSLAVRAGLCRVFSFRSSIGKGLERAAGRESLSPDLRQNRSPLC